MSNETPARVQSGVPAGGQFATEARAESSLTLSAEAEARYDQIAAVTKAVAAELGIGAPMDDGGGEYIGFDLRHPQAGDRDMAFYMAADEASRPEDAERWIFQRGDSGERLPNGCFTDAVTSELTLDAEPAEVATWIKSQMRHFGTPGAPA